MSRSSIRSVIGPPNAEIAITNNHTGTLVTTDTSPQPTAATNASKWSIRVVLPISLRARMTLESTLPMP